MPRILLVVGSLLFSDSTSTAEKPEQKAESTGGFVTVPSPITSATVHSVKRDCEALLNSGARIIVFDIQPGTSDYGNCLNLAHYIESIGGAKTRAFVRQPLSGHAVMVALSAGELVISSRATLGDIGKNEKSISPGMLAEYSDLARRRNLEHQAVILGMLDKKYRVWKVATARGTRYVLDEDLKKLESEEQIKSKEVLIEAGQLGNFTGDQLRQLNLAQVMAETRAEVAELYGMPAKSAIETSRAGVEWRPVRIRIADFISPLLKEYVCRHVKESRDRGRNFFILEIDSYGGDGMAGLDLAEFLKDQKGVKTVAYIPEKAISAAAFIALGCDDIVMHRDAKLGDCGAMFIQGGQFQYVPEKVVSVLSTSLETIAKAKGYPPTLARAMIEKDLVVKEVRDKRTGRVSFLSEQELQQAGIEDLEVRRIVKDKDIFLTMDGEAALSLNFAGDLVDNFDGLREIYGLGDAEIAEVAPNWVDTLITVLNHPFVSFILIVAGILGLYLELKLPGVALPGILAALCFLLFFWSHVMGGTATALEILLFLAGLLCLGIEILVIPGFGVFGFTGIILMVVSIILASQTFILPQGSGEWRELAMHLGSMVFAFLCLFGFAYFVGKYLHEMPLVGRVVLKPDFAVAGSDDVLTFEASPFGSLMGKEGMALTTLRPAGRVRFGDEFVDVVTEGDYIDAGTRVRVIEVVGNRVVVKRAL